MKVRLDKWNEDKTSKNVVTRKLIKLMNWDQGLQLQNIELININARKPVDMLRGRVKDIFKLMIGTNSKWKKKGFFT